MKPADLKIKYFISEPVEVRYIIPPAYSKKPTCPDGFIWKEVDFDIVDCLSEWKNYTRHGMSSRNMQPQHAELASKRGSWGVGKFFFDVETRNGQLFRIYYDRAPKDASDRQGMWILLAELNKE
jgi:hypothetical protein